MGSAGKSRGWPRHIRPTAHISDPRSEEAKRMENNFYEDPDSTLMSRQQNRLRAALTKLSDVCQRNSKLTEAVLSKPKAGGNSNCKQRQISCPPTPPLRTVSLFKIKTHSKIEATREETETRAGCDYKERKSDKSPQRDQLEYSEGNVRKIEEAEPVLICESSARVRRSLENLSVPGWFTKYKQNSRNTNINKWTRTKTEGGWRRDSSVSSLCDLSRSPSPLTRSSWSTSPSTRSSPSPSVRRTLSPVDNLQSMPQRTRQQSNIRSLPPLPPGQVYLGWRHQQGSRGSFSSSYLLPPAQRLASSCS